ncbi:trypsin Inhibitor like cysteine rich domain protein, partial [Ostertagia ostertagi]
MTIRPTTPLRLCMYHPSQADNTQAAENLKCAVNETVVECRVCEADCVSIFTRSDCDECGSPACSCMQGYARNPQGTCVYWGDCPVNSGLFSNLHGVLKSGLGFEKSSESVMFTDSAQTTTTTTASTTRKKFEKPSKIK